MKLNRIAITAMIAIALWFIGMAKPVVAQAVTPLDSIWLHVSDAKEEKLEKSFNLTLSWELYIKKALDKKGTKYASDWEPLPMDDVKYTFRVDVAKDSAFSRIVKTEETVGSSLTIRDLSFDSFYVARAQIVNPPANYRDDFAAGRIYKHEKPTGGKSRGKYSQWTVYDPRFSLKHGGWQTIFIMILGLVGIFIIWPITWSTLRLANIFPPNKPGFLYSALPFDRTGKCDHLSEKGNVYVREVAKYWSRAMASMVQGPEHWANTEAFIKASLQEQEEIKKRVWTEEGLPAIEQAIDICKNGVPGIKLKKKPLEYPFPRILLAAMENQRANRNNWWASQEMDRAVESTAYKEIDSLKGWFLTTFWALGAIEPMLGLFGTVTGIQWAFMKIQETVSEDPNAPMSKTIEALSGGIFMALITTVWGLLFGIPFMLAYYYYRGKADFIFGKWEEIVVEILNRA